MKKRTGVIIILGIIILLLALLTVFFLQSGENQQWEQAVYEDDECRITAEFPKDWECRILEWSAGDENVEGTPDSGIEIYVNGDKNSEVYVFRFVSHIAPQEEDVESSSAFTSDTGLEGTYYKMKNENILCHLVAFEGEEAGFYGVSITMDEKTFEENEAQIKEVLNRIKIEKK